MPQSLLEQLRDAANSLDAAERTTTGTPLGIEGASLIKMSHEYAVALSTLLRDAEAEIKRQGR